MVTSRDPSQRPSATIQGLRPHWLRLALLLLLVAAAIFLPPMGDQAGVIAFPLKPPPLIGEFLPVPQNQAELRAAIERANSAFRAAHARADLAALSGVATGAWREEERRATAELRANGTTERWTPQSIKLLSLADRGTTATACTDEYWERRIVDAAGRLGPAERRHHIEQYTLVRVG